MNGVTQNAGWLYTYIYFCRSCYTYYFTLLTHYCTFNHWIYCSVFHFYLFSDNGLHMQLILHAYLITFLYLIITSYFDTVYSRFCAVVFSLVRTMHTVRVRYRYNPWVQKRTFNTLGPRQKDCHFAEDISKFAVFNASWCILIRLFRGNLFLKPVLHAILNWFRIRDKPFEWMVNY